MKWILILYLAAFLVGCNATGTGQVTEHRLSDFSGTMAYASENTAENGEIYRGVTSDIYAYDSGSPLVLSEYSTKFNKKVLGRSKNVLLASNGIDRKIVFPGDDFSFNETVGPTDKESGFQRSKIFIKGKELIGYGGGVCQVSSTLYNAVREAGLDVTERHPHSKDVKYVPKNQDAAVSYGGIDFKFTNNFDFPIKINSKIVDDQITVSIEKI